MDNELDHHTKSMHLHRHVARDRNIGSPLLILADNGNKKIIMFKYQVASSKLLMLWFLRWLIVEAYHIYKIIVI